MRQIENIRLKTREPSVERGMKRLAYDAVQYLNPSSIAKAFVGKEEEGPEIIDIAAVKYAFENPERTTQPAAQDRMDRGTLAHLMLLQPERLAKDVAVYEGKGDRGSDEYKRFATLNAMKLVIRDVDHERVAEAVKAFNFLPEITNLLSDLDAEVAMFSKERGFYVKGLVDAVTRPFEGINGPTIKLIDLKTTEAGISPQALKTTIRRFCNREKMAAYRRWYVRESKWDGEVKCINLFLSMIPPYAVSIETMTSRAMRFGEKRLDLALDHAQKCLESKNWPMLVRDNMTDVEDWEMDDEIQ